MSTALYRRYRPETFDEVIGQEHVTDPLVAALTAGRVTHAYLFSGPRGCGKTSSARIFARCLNCAEGPTATPCGTCDSCVELGRGGSGSLDVVEIDAASHNGVDDARDLRERAAFAPARDRYKIFILDEAHMVTTQGFNALLKLVEEPPEHVKFIFATTEPEKVIGTIRSRTHHYPFRLVPPGTLTAYLESLCQQESIEVSPGVLPMVIRAGGGSVRDSLSVLDQLMAGSVGGSLDYERAAALLGYTSASLLDDAVAALAARDGGALFQVVDRMVQSGHDPRRFVEDLLQRLRDLVIIAVAGDAAAPALGPVPADQLEQMQEQARLLGAAAASRAADLTNAALTDMTGATSPRLQLELLCARLLITPGSHAGPAQQAPQRDGAAQASPAGSPAPQSQPQRHPQGAPAPSAPGPAASRPEGPPPSAESAQRHAPAASPSESTREGSEQQRRDAATPGDSAPSSDAGPAQHEARSGASQAGHGGPVSPAVEQPRQSPAASASNVSSIAAAARRATQALRGGTGTGAQPAGGPQSQAPAQPSGATPGESGDARETALSPQSPQRGDAESAQRSAPQAQASSEQSAPVAASPAQPSDIPSPPEHEASSASATDRSTSASSEAADQASGPPQTNDSEPIDTAMVRRRWSEVLDTLSRIRRASWVLVNQSATPGEVRDGVMKLIFETEGLKSAFTNGHHDENVIAALRETLGVTVRIKAETGTAAAAESHRGGSAEPEPDPEPSPPPPDDDPYDGVSADDETIENTTLMGVPVIERILEGTVVEESDE